jgi:circadian clock protein KaiC
VNARTTGAANLDLILGGGLEPGSVVFVAGGSGSGKTVLAQQICFANASPERPAIYYTMFSESHDKLIRHMEHFDFFDRSLLGTALELHDLRGVVHGSEGQQVPLEGGEAVEHITTELARSAIERRPSVVVIDSIKALREVTTKAEFRRLVYDLASRVAHSGAVLVLVGEYSEDEVRTDPEFAVGDGIILLANEPVGRFHQRSLRVVKMRGAAPLEGTHTFQIAAQGLDVYPRFETTLPLVETHEDVQGSTQRLATGITRLDEMLGGGLPKASATLVAGPSGSGKTVLAMHFIAEGVARGERCLYLSFQQTEQRMMDRARNFGWDFATAADSGELTLTHLNPVEVSLDKIGTNLRTAAAGERIDRVVIDSLSEIAPAARGTGRFPDYLSALASMFRSLGATTIFTSETTAFFGPAFELPHGLAFVADNVILLRYAELESKVARVLGVMKMRDGDHDKTLAEIQIGNRGIEIKGRFEGLTGILGGTPLIDLRPPR